MVNPMSGVPIENAMGKASQGWSVAWVDDGMGVHDAALEASEIAGAEGLDCKVNRAMYRESVRFKNGGRIGFFRSAEAVRGFHADAVFATERHRTQEAMQSIAPAFSTSPHGAVYALFERVC